MEDVLDDEGYGQGEVYGPWYGEEHTGGDFVEEGYEYVEDGEVIGGHVVSVEEYFEGI